MGFRRSSMGVAKVIDEVPDPIDGVPKVIDGVTEVIDGVPGPITWGSEGHQ